MKSRILTAVLGLPLFFAVAFFSHTVVLPIAVAFFAVIGVLEMIGCLGFRRQMWVVIPSIIVVLISTLSARYFIELAGSIVAFAAFFAALIFAYAFYLMCLAVVSKGKRDVSDMTAVAVAVSYITVGFTSLVILRDMTSVGSGDYGLCLFILVFVGAWMPDIGGYFGGRAFGRHKLIPDVSPKKTVEGAITGVIFGGASFAAAGLIFDLLGMGAPNYIALVPIGLFSAVVSIFGDLIASLIKRKYGIKDYGKLFPGHGGVMDRFDSVIATAPFILIMFSLSWLITTLIG